MKKTKVLFQGVIMSEIKSISVSPELSKLAKDNKVGWSEAARVGMSLLLAERGVKDFDNSLNVVRKMRIFQKIAEETSQELNEIKEKLAKNA